MLSAFLDSDGRVIAWPKKHAQKQSVCEYLATKFKIGITYHEREINEILKQWHTFSDWPLLRRELIERGLFKRNREGTEYMLVPTLSLCFSDNNTSVRRMVDADIEKVVLLVNEAFSYQDQAKGAPRTTIEQMREYHGKYTMYVFEQGGALIGTVYTDARDNGLHFGLLALLPHHRGKGLGNKIVRAIIELAAQSGCATANLDYLSVAPWLKTYYESFGFKETGKREPWRGMEMIEMALSTKD